MTLTVCEKKAFGYYCTCTFTVSDYGFGFIFIQWALTSFHGKNNVGKNNETQNRHKYVKLLIAHTVL